MVWRHQHRQALPTTTTTTTTTTEERERDEVWDFLLFGSVGDRRGSREERERGAGGIEGG